MSRLRRFVPVAAISTELVRFDTQLLEQPDISGVQYQQGTLAGYEVREYLLERWGRRCAYCGATKTPLQVEHIVPRARGGSDRISNLTLACAGCNQAKGARTAQEFGHPDVQGPGPPAPPRHRSGQQHTLGALWAARRRRNPRRSRHRRAHQVQPLPAGTAQGQHARHPRHARRAAASHPGHRPHSRQMCRMDKHGFPRTSAKSARTVHGFRTGDRVRATVSTGKKVGSYTGRVAVRASGSFNITTPTGTIQGLHHRFFRLLHRADGYSYQGGGASSHP